VRWRKQIPFARLGIHAGLLIGSFLFAFLVVDVVAFYGFGIKHPGYKTTGFYQYNPLLGHFHAPNMKGLWYTYRDGTRYTATTNSFGFPDSPRTLEKNTPRIALIGDSVTQCWEMKEQDRCHQVLEDILKRTYEVLNFGVRGYGTDQTSLAFETIGVRFSPDVVVYNFCINDIYDNANHTNKPYFILDDRCEWGIRLEGYPVEIPAPATDNLRSISSRVSRFLTDHSYSYRNIFGTVMSRLIDPIHRRLLGGKKSPPIPLDDHWELRPYKKEYNEEDQQRWELTKRILYRLSRIVRDRGTKFLLVECIDKPSLDGYWQYKIQKTYGDLLDFEKVNRLMNEFCSQNGIPFLSLYQEAKDRNLPVNSLFHPSDTIHMNREGALFYAECVAEQITAEGWAALPNTIP